MTSPARTAATHGAKALLRTRMLAARNALDPGFREEASAAIARHALELTAGARCVVLYSNIGTEVETRVLIAALLARGTRVALPLSLRRPRGLEMREIAAYPAGLVAGPFGILEPDPAAHPHIISCAETDLALLPCVAFDDSGGRLGYGAGYIDGWLSSDRPCRALGLAFAAQRTAAIPADPWDRRLDGVVTEQGLLVFEQADYR